MTIRGFLYKIGLIKKAPKELWNTRWVTPNGDRIVPTKNNPFGNSRNLTEERQKEIREWYKKTMPDKCFEIFEPVNHRMEGEFGTHYYNAVSKKWSDPGKFNGYMKAIGKCWYVKLKDDE